MNILHLDSSILGEKSVSRDLSAAVTARLRALNTDATYTYHDLAAQPIDHLSGGEFASLGKGEPSETLARLLAADTVVLGVGFYNFGIPSQLKAWVDHIVVPGQTFNYTANGPVGLTKGKRAVIAIARGGVYAPGTPGAAVEHADTYLRAILGFIGFERIDTIAAEGVAMGPEAKDAAIAKAHAEIAQLT